MSVAVEALRRLSAALDDLVVGDGLDPGSGDEARVLLVEVEGVVRRAQALAVLALDVVQGRGLYVDDGHGSAKVMARHVGRLSGGEAAARDRCRRMFADLEELAAVYRGGGIGTDQVRLLGRVWANPRVREAMRPRQGWFVGLAKKLSFPRFERKVRRWEQLTDADGAEPANVRTHANRNAQLVQNHFDLSWDLQGRFGALDGAEISAVFRAYTDAEWKIDWAAAVATYGDAACVADMERSDAQRRADALKQIVADAAANPAGSMPAGFVHSMVWSVSAYEEMASRFDGNPPKPFDIDDFRCETIDGDPLEPYEAFANSLVNRIRRVIVDAKGVVIDMGRARFFTGAARDAVTVGGDGECVWKGCWVPTSRCQIDHLHDHAKRGRTCPGNGAPCCGRHNRWKQKGYRVWRDNTGTIHITRPDGTEIQ